MVIHQFNKLIRNKWLWGAFAIAISLFFAFDFLIADFGKDENQQEDGADTAGTLAGEVVDLKLFQAIAEDVRGLGRQQDYTRSNEDVHLEAWRRYAALKVAENNGIVVSDDELKAIIRGNQMFQVNGGFSSSRYQQWIQMMGIGSCERFEAYLRRAITLDHLAKSLITSSCWVAPVELDSALADNTDTFKVRVAKFDQEKADADAVAVDDAAIRKWYDANTNSIALPERIKIRYVKYDAGNTNILAKMSVTEDEMRDYYDATIDKYTSTDTNGVEVVKKFDEVKGEIDKELRKVAAVYYYETNLTYRVYGIVAKEGASRLDEIAKEDGLKVMTSDWFTVDGGYVEGFMKYASNILPGARDFTAAVSQLDPSSDNMRYGVVSSANAVWLIERADISAKHLPTFDEAKLAIKPRVLRDAKADAFKAKVEAIAAKGANEVLASKNISTNIEFSVANVRDGNATFENSYQVAKAAMGLSKGEVSDFTLLSTGHAILVVCEDRIPANAGEAMVRRSQVRDELAGVQLRQLPDEWMKWNLEHMGYKTGIFSATTSTETTDSEE